MIQATMARQARPERQRDGAHDFDFLHGRYRVHRLHCGGHAATPGQWESFEAVSVSTPLPRGSGRIDELMTDGRTAGAGTTLRLYDPRNRDWRLYRMESRGGMLHAPLRGSFADDGIGIFEGLEQRDGRELRLRLTWSRPTAWSARCEQVLSPDGGRSWQLDWAMHYIRLADHPAVADHGLALATGLMFEDTPAYRDQTM